MADPKTGMTKPEMKKLMMIAKREPVNCGVALAKESGFALLLMDKIKPSRALEASLKKDFLDLKAPAFGTVFINTEEDARLAKFTLNKAPGGLARRLVKTLKGTGFKKVVINDEAGNELDSFISDEPDEDDADEATEAPAEEAPPAAAAPAAPDAAALTRELAALAGGIAKVAAGQPDLQRKLVGLAQQGQAAIKASDLEAAAAAIATLRQEMSGAGPAPAAASGGTDAATFAKAKSAWEATHGMMMADLDKLRAAILDTYKAEGVAPELDSSFSETIRALVDTVDLELAEKLDAAGKAGDPADKAKASAEAKALIQSYQSYIDNDPVVTDLDDNPFVPVSIHKRVSATLTALASAVH